MDKASAFHVSLRNVTKIYGLGPDTGRPGGNRKRAVDSLSLEIGEGTRLGIIGRNGAGKSTLVHLIAGIAEQSSGEMEVRGNVTSIMTLGIGLREEMSGRENIYVDGEIQGRSRAEVDLIIDDIIAFAELGEFIDHPVRTYSTGMKARLAFAMITYIDPEVLIIDEALSAGDAKFSAKAGRKIREICQRGKIVVLVSHSMGAIREICNRCIWIDNGRVIMDGTPDQVTEAYLDAVKAETEAVLKERFSGLAGPRSFAEGYAVRHAELVEAATGQPNAAIERGTEVILRASLQVPDGAATPSLHFHIDRLDGLRTTEAIHPLPRSPEGFCSDVAIALNPLPCGPGTHSVVLQIHDGSSLAAEYRLLFECTSRLTLIGGRPALTWPAVIRVLGEHDRQHSEVIVKRAPQP